MDRQEDAVRHAPWRAGLAALLGGFALGCAHDPGPHYPPDPLLVSKKPVEGKLEKAAPALLARSDPPVPQLPDSVLVAKPRPPVQAIPTSRPSGTPKTDAKPNADRPPDAE